MANICSNTLYASSEDSRNIEYLKEYFTNSYKCDYIEYSDDCIDVEFSSNWTFPTLEMAEMVEKMPNKDDIFIRCLSIEYGDLYHELWVYEGEDWNSV